MENYNNLKLIIDYWSNFHLSERNSSPKFIIILKDAEKEVCSANASKPCEIVTYINNSLTSKCGYFLCRFRKIDLENNLKEDIFYDLNKGIREIIEIHNKYGRNF